MTEPRPTAVLVDDDPLVRAGLRMMLGGPDGVDGLAATRALMKTYPGTKVLVLTTFDADDYVVEALRAGARGFVLKDTPPQKLVAAVHDVAHGDHALSPSVTALLVNQVAAGASGPDGEGCAARAAAQLARLTDRERGVAMAVAARPRRGRLRRRLVTRTRWTDSSSISDGVSPAARTAPSSDGCSTWSETWPAPPAERPMVGSSSAWGHRD